jgi:hypothetical protein
MKMRRRYPTRGGRPVPTVPVPIPFVAAAAMLGAFALGRATGRIRGTGRGPCRAASWRFAAALAVKRNGPSTEKRPLGRRASTQTDGKEAK